MPIILLCVLIFVAWLRYQISKNSKKSTKDSTTFWEKERQANSVRKKDISNLDYILIPMDTLPIHDNANEEITSIQNAILNLVDKKILNLSNYSNTDLKLTFGTANIHVLSQYDQNYTLLIRSLHNWATLLIKSGQIADATTVLMYAVSIGSDISGTYLMLANIYESEKKQDKIKELINIVNSQNSLLKETVLTSLNATYKKASHVPE